MTAEIIIGPWKKGRKVIVPDSTNEDKILEDIAFADDLNEEVMAQVIHTLEKNDIDIEEESFIQNMSFIIEYFSLFKISILLFIFNEKISGISV